MYHAGAVLLDPKVYGSAAAQLDENPYMLATVEKIQRPELTEGMMRFAQVMATMALAYEVRESRYILDERMHQMETLHRNWAGW